MRTTLRLLAALAALSVPGLAVARPAAKPAPVKASADWTKTYSVTPEGGFRMGDPNAKVALVEYGSLTCPHCKHFADTGAQPLLQNYIRTGKVSYEFRPMILNGIDLAATLVARCGGPSRFFPIASKLYATQDAWASKISNIPEPEKEKLKALPVGEMMAGIAERGGLISFASANGIPAAKAEACLKNDAAASKLAQMYQAAMDKGVKGTPTFFVNGKHVDAIDWPTLEPFLKGVGT
jgi:protein-disulfide isomerase